LQLYIVSAIFRIKKKKKKRKEKRKKEKKKKREEKRRKEKEKKRKEKKKKKKFTNSFPFHQTRCLSAPPLLSPFPPSPPFWQAATDI
jgi:sRNA-binding protein